MDDSGARFTLSIARALARDLVASFMCAVAVMSAGALVAAASPPASGPVVGAAAFAAHQQSAPAEQENLFWQSIANSTDPADFEAYLEVFPNGVFRRLAENRLAALRSLDGNVPASSGRPAGGVSSPASGSRVFGVGGASLGGAVGVDAPPRRRFL